jgi:site-specific recombinase XerD
MEQIKLKQIIVQVLDAMSSFNLNESTIKTYKYSAFSPINTYAKKRGKLIYSKEITDDFLKIQKERLNNNKISEKHYRILRKAVELLDEYYTTGTLEWRIRHNRSKIKVNAYFDSIVLDFEKKIVSQLAPGTVLYIKSNTLQFLEFIENNGHIDLDSITINEVHDFLLNIAPKHRGSMGNVLLSIKKFFGYLNEHGITNLNVEKVLHKASRARKKVLPCFTHEEVQTILNQIDTSTAKGKRDYAIIYLASHTGLRSADIINLKLTDIDWNKDEICIVQKKTGRSLVLPLDINTEMAISDYILSGRPNTDSPCIFIRSIAPYTKLSDRGSSYSIIKKYCNSAGISNQGFHALRRSMGTWMLEADVPLPTISQVLGHHNQDSTKQYLSLNNSMLAECALNLNGIETQKEELL